MQTSSKMENPVVKFSETVTKLFYNLMETWQRKKNSSTLKKSHFIDERFIKFKKISSKYIQESNPLSYNTFKSLQYVMETYCNLAFSLLYCLSSDTSRCLWRGYYWDVCTQYWCSWLKSQPLYFMYKFLLMHT